MSTASSDSHSLSGVFLPQGPTDRAPDTLWLDGDVLACACPECGAPMSVRLWLLIAECWRCGTSIELTEEQEQAALKLLEERRAQQAGETPAAAQPVPPSPVQPAEPTPVSTASPVQTASPVPATAPQPVEPTSPDMASLEQRTIRRAPTREEVPAFRDPPPRPAPARVAPPGKRPAYAQPDRARQRLAQRRKTPWLALWLRELLRQLPAWLASLVLHLVLLILLGLWLIQPESEPPRMLILATQVNELNDPGHVLEPQQLDAVEFEDPGLLNAPEDVLEPEPIERLDETPLEMPIFGQDNPDELSDLLATPPMLRGPTAEGASIAGRDLHVRAELALTAGGTIDSEAAVARGLEWLKRHQFSDGHWSLDVFAACPGCDGQCSQPGGHSDTSATALGLLPFLGAGLTQRTGDAKDVVQRGLSWLVAAQADNGDLRGPGFGNMYAHGQATIALCEAYAMTGDPKLKEPAQRAVNFIVAAQHAGGGWRYGPGEPGDTSVVGWQLMALRSAQMAYLDVPPEVFQRANKFLDSVQTQPSEGLFTYMPGGGATAAMTAEGLLCRQYAGWKRNNSQLTSGVAWLLKNCPPHDDVHMYYWYYATQVMHHMGGRPWEQWNGVLRDRLVALQETRGHQAGSWSPRGHHDISGGRLYMTALAVCTLEVYYRHMPLYQQQADQPAAE